MSVCKTGSQRPSLLHEPPDAVDWTFSDIALECAEAWGYVLDEWQKWLVRCAFVRRADTLWSARDFGIEVARQNGKNIVLEVIELCAVLMFGDRLVTHSAHRADTSAEHFRSLKEHIESSDELLQFMPNTPNNGFQTANGKEQIEFRNGARIVFKARQNSSGRGPRPQRIIFDEALVLEHPQIGSMAPGIVAQRNAQLIFASSPPRATSTVLHSLRERALHPEPGDRLFYAAWNNPEGTDVNDEDAEAGANPSLGYGRMTEESLRANRRLMSAEEYAREHLGIPERPISSGGVWPPEVWRAVVDADAEPSGALFVGVDGSPDRSSVSVAIAGGGVVEVLEPRPTVASIVDVLAGLWARWSAPVAFDPAGPVGWLKPELERLNVPVVEVSGQKMGQACGALFTAVQESKLRVRRHPDLEAAVAGARTSPKGDVWVWARKDGSVDVSPLVAVTLAWWAAAQAQPVEGDHFAIVL